MEIYYNNEMVLLYLEELGKVIQAESLTQWAPQETLSVCGGESSQFLWSY